MQKCKSALVLPAAKATTNSQRSAALYFNKALTVFEGLAMDAFTTEPLDTNEVSISFVRCV